MASLNDAKIVVATTCTYQKMQTTAKKALQIFTKITRIIWIS